MSQKKKEKKKGRRKSEERSLCCHRFQLSYFKSVGASLIQQRYKSRVNTC
jgi:hypothetical protein